MMASIAALLGLALPHVPTIDQLPWWGVTLAVVSLLAFLAFVALEIQSGKRHRVYDQNDAAGIRKYMHEWISPGGRVAIWTRDMSWANNPETRALLQEKASAGELIICLPEQVEITTDLEQRGAEICAYGKQSGLPAARFTVAYFERDGSRVAVGRAWKRLHIIDEFDSGDHPAFYLAEDLVRLARLRSRQRG